jgi:Cdc6-like AAA superfamily ATPase
MKMSDRKEINKIRQEVRPWLDKWQISPQVFDNLPLHQKTLLHGIVCTGDITPSDLQLRTLYQDLNLGERRTGRRGHFGSSVESLDHEELRQIFTRLSLSEILPDLFKY